MVSQKEKNEKETFEPKPTVLSGEKITIIQKHKNTNVHCYLIFPPMQRCGSEV